MTADDRRTEALRRLPYVHALALRLRADGVPDEVIIERLGIEPEAFGPLLAVATEKLAAILDDLSG